MKLYDKSGRVLALFLIIFLFPIGDSGEFPITTDTNHQKNPAIYGNIIIWVDYGDSSIDICAYNLITKEEFYITKNSSSQCAPDIYGNIVVWEDHRNGNSYIYGYNLCTNEEFQITENSDSQQKPAIHKDTIVWADSRNKNSDIFGYNLCTREEFQITTNPKNQHNPAIYGDIIVWDDDRNGKGDIYGYNLSTMEEFPIVVGPGSQYHPVIYGDIVVWVDGRNHNEDGSLDIYGYNVSTREEFQIAVGPSDQYEPAIYGNTVLWTDDRNGKPDIYCQNLSTQEEFQITTDPGRQQNSAICGNTIIWEDHRNWNFDIYGCSLPTSEEFQITTDRNKQTTPVIYGNTTVWVDYRNGNSDIYGYNLFAKEEFQISSDRSQQESPAIYGDIVVWEDYRNDNWDIYGYNLCAKEEFQITTDPGNQKHAAVYEDIVVWMDWRNGNENSDIYGFSLSTQEEFQITIAPDSQCYPAIYGDIVIWLDLRNSNWDIYGYNLSTKEEFGVVIDSSSQREPAIYENIVVWTYYRNGNSDIYGTDLSTRKEFQITTNDCEQDYPAIYENIIVWRDSRSGDSDIFGYNLSTKEEFQITTDRNHQESPAIYGDIVVWEDNRNGNSDIYGYSIFTIAYSTSPPTTTPPRNSIFKDPFLLAILSLIISLLALLTYFFGIDIKTIRKFLGKPKSGRKSNKDDQFNELVLSPDWFKKQAESQIANVKKKYLPGLHVEGLVDLKVHYLLGDQVFLKDLKNRKNEIITFITKIKKISEEIHSERLTANHQELLSDIEESFESSLRRIEERAQEIDEFIDLVSNAKFEESSQFNFSEEFSSETNALLSMLEPILKKRTEKVTFLPEERIFYEKLNEVAYELYSSFNYWQSLKEIITIFKQNELIILGRAGMGKTHLVCSFVDHRTKNGKPTILLFGNNFYRYHEIKTRIIELLGVPSDCHWEDLIIALEEAARASKSKLLFVIDGINESEDIRIWQTQLLGFFQYLKCSPWIIPIVTCRDTYVPRIFGDKEIQNTGYVYGFSNINEALEKYFNYFKIQPQLTFSSQEAFRHPLYLRILCDTYGDSSRKEPAVVDIREQNLYKVFDDYIRKCNEEIFLGSEKVDDDPNINHVQKALLSFGKEIWNSGKSYVPRSKAREIIDPIRPWSGNLFKAILEEGLLISRDFISYENEEVVDFTYDLLGDYVIAQSLLEGKTSHAIIESLQSLRELSPLTEQSRHPRLEGILRCLAVLLPEKTGKHLYCILPDFLSAQIASEEALFEMDPEFIDKEAKDWLSERFKSGDESGKRRILSQLINTAYVPDHPLGFLYIDQLLCTLTMSRRDLFWTEYIRENDEFLHDIIIDFEDRCMRGELGSDEQEFVIQEARLLRWILTSTNRGLRDIATRALYWFGRRFPERLFELTEESFSVNDPYIPERMLAAAYGVAMAYPSEDSVRDFAVKIYDNFFIENAPYATTHLLMRDYARHFIELALNRDSAFLTDHQKERITPPFEDGGVRNWGEDQEAKEELMKSSPNWGYGPIRMDFAEYIIGDLINWVNPGENFPRLAESITKVMWRMKELGYNEDEFGEIDISIMRYYPNPMIEAEATGRLERYGKKYSWIAFFELAGFYSDSYGDQKYWKNLQIRSVYVDIDPSFPGQPQEFEVIKTDYLGDRTVEVHEWIENGDTPKINDYLILEELCGEKGPWVLLDGSIDQEDIQAKRSIFIYPRGLVVGKRNVKNVVEHLKEQHLGGRCPPRIPEDYYVFAGEIPWCETFPYNGESTIEFATEAKNEKISIKDVLIPVRSFNWESYHSITNPGQLADVPARELADRLDLRSHPQTFDLYDSESRRASITLKWGKSWHTEHRLIYLREDLLEKFLRDTNQELVWAIWGERRFVSEDIIEFEEFRRKFQHGVLYRNIVVYSEIKPE